MDTMITTLLDSANKLLHIIDQIREENEQQQKDIIMNWTQKMEELTKENERLKTEHADLLAKHAALLAENTRLKNSGIS